MTVDRGIISFFITQIKVLDKARQYIIATTMDKQWVCTHVCVSQAIKPSVTSILFKT